MQVQKIRRATLVALAVGGLASGGSGIASADGHGATASDGSSVTGNLFQQNTAQEHGQNNNCSNPNSMLVQPERMGGRTETRCATGDASFNKHTVIKGGGADATGGSGEVGVFRQNTAQKGRQNNNCADPNISGINLADGRTDNHCTHLDRSFSEHTLAEGGGADATGGSGAVSAVQQNTAQEGRQNNNCADPNDTIISTGGGWTDNHCTNLDRSFSEHTLAEGGGAEATGGSGEVGHLVQQNTAQEGRQNNNCANPNQTDITVADGWTDNHCTNLDRSFNEHTLAKGGGADATGGSGEVGVVQQNTAQEGRQNNNCANPNDTFITSTDTRGEARCATIDHSTNVGTAEISGGADATGGSGEVGHLAQQNTAQEGRQNNNCGNRNGMALIASGNTQTQCVAVDNSKNIDSVHQ